MDNDPLASLMSFFLVPIMHDLVFTAETCAVERQTGLHAKLVSKGIVPLDFYRVHKSLQGLYITECLDLITICQFRAGEMAPWIKHFFPKYQHSSLSPDPT